MPYRYNIYRGRNCKISLSFSQRVSVSLPALSVSHGCTSWLIFAQSGSKVTTPKSKNEFFGVNIAPPLLALFLLICYVTLWPWPLTFWPWSVDIHGGSRGQSLDQVWRSYSYLAAPIGYQWQCVCSHCTCAISCDLCPCPSKPPFLAERSWKSMQR